ncbi:MAG: hypothetical protein ABSD28_03480 [Tepidisphaeraceae bacterium]
MQVLFQHLVTLLPRQPGTITLIAAVVGSIMGLSLWIAGARMSRSMLTLAAVAMGTAIGMKLPLWCHWQVDPMAPAVGGAMVLGVSAYVFHRIWVGAWLGAVLTVWTALVLWATRGAEFHWRWPEYDPAQTLPQYLASLWQNVPETMQQCLGFSAVAAMLVGISAALLWPRVGIALLWSAAGISLLLPAAVTALSRIDPQVLAQVPRRTSDQLALLAGLVGLGAIFQWRTNPLIQSAQGDSGGDSKGKAPDGAKEKDVKHQAAD